MSPKVSFGLLLRLAILLAAFLVQSSEGASYRDFARKHIDHPVTRAPNANAYCNLMMARRGLTRGSCRPTNTFIHARSSDIKRICRRGGGTLVNRRRKLYNSRSRFRVVHCQLTSRRPQCRYAGRRRTRRIRVGCRNRQPVHFDGYA